MTYTIELSYDINKYGNETKSKIIDMSEYYQCKSNSYLYEFEGQKQIQRSHCIISIVFSDDNINKMIEFIKTIKRLKKVYIEVIFNDNNKIIYTSSYYRKKNKTKAIKHSENELNLLKLSTLI